MKIFQLLVVVIFIMIILDIIVTKMFSLLARKYFLCKEKSKQISKTNISDVKSTKMTLASVVVNKIYTFVEGWIRYKIIRLGRIPCHWYRKFLLTRLYGLKCGKKVVIYGGFEIRDPWNISIGEGTIIGDEVKLDGRNGIEIGKNVNFSTGVWIWSDQHDVNDPYFANNDKGGKVVIGDRAWLSSRTIVLPKRTVSEGAVVSAGAVVVNDCEPFGIYGGVPAKKIGDRNNDIRYEFDGSHLPFY